jgi:hypothetical protein
MKKMIATFADLISSLIDENPKILAYIHQTLLQIKRVNINKYSLKKIKALNEHRFS